MSDSENLHKTRPITFRLDQNLIMDLEYEARKKDISVNLLVSITLRNFVNWHSPELSAGFLSFPKTTLIRIMDKLSEDQAKQIGKIHFEKDMQNIILMLRGKYTVETFCDSLESWMKNNNMVFRHTEKDGQHNFVIQHDLNKNWSWYISEFIKDTLEYLTKSKIDMTVTENSVAFEYDISKTLDY